MWIFQRTTFRLQTSLTANPTHWWIMSNLVAKFHARSTGMLMVGVLYWPHLVFRPLCLGCWCDPVAGWTATVLREDMAAVCEIVFGSIECISLTLKWSLSQCVWWMSGTGCVLWPQSSDCGTNRAVAVGEVLVRGTACVCLSWPRRLVPHDKLLLHAWFRSILCWVACSRCGSDACQQRAFLPDAQLQEE